MKVTVWGTRGSIATPGPETVRYGGNTSCVQVEGEDGSVVVLDAGTGIRRLSAHIPKGLKRIDVLLTHLHMDHLQGLGFFGPLYNPNIEVHLWGPDSATLSLEARLNRYLSPPLFPVHLRELPCKMHLHTVPDETLRVGELTVTPSLLCHPGPTVGYRVTSPDGTVAYIPDHEPSLAGAFRDLDTSWISGFECAHDATLLLHDAQYTPEQYQKYVGWGHSGMDDAVVFAELVRAQYLLLFHHDPGHTDDALEQMATPYLGQHPKGEMEVSLAKEGEAFQIKGGTVRKISSPAL